MGWHSRLPGPLENAGKLPRPPTESKKEILDKLDLTDWFLIRAF